MQIFWLLVLLLVPALILFACKRWKFLDHIGPVVLAYAVGILITNIVGGLLPETDKVLGAAATTLSEISVPLSIPLLLFGQNLFKQLNSYRKMLFNFALATLSIGLVAPVVSVLFREKIADIWKLSGMLVGVYTGGTPNMASVGLALDVENSVFLVLTAADTLLGGTYLLIILTVMKPLLKRFFTLEAPQKDALAPVAEGEKITLLDRLKGLGLSALVVGLSAGASLLVFNKLHVPLVMLLLTALGLGASLIGPIQRLKGSSQSGEYLILAFCVAIGAMIKFSQFTGSTSGVILLYCTSVMVGAILLHLLLSRLFKQDLDRVLLASTAAIFGPPMVGAVAESLKRNDLIGPGLAVGVLGYAVGNYLGLGIAYALHLII